MSSIVSKDRFRGVKGCRKDALTCPSNKILKSEVVTAGLCRVEKLVSKKPNNQLRIYRQCLRLINYWARVFAGDPTNLAQMLRFMGPSFTLRTDLQRNGLGRRRDLWSEPFDRKYMFVAKFLAESSRVCLS
ncbi:unnamed protein product [Protopolystoma xenopodis]|uniref:Uncharacterized protein n=1 Tax=Protopolystoma xenopodis TaxID=117903 RepID=A0A448WNH3_9PLAT|nr:unnamed protein product [Protopolystoma xenopodis]